MHYLRLMLGLISVGTSVMAMPSVRIVYPAIPGVGVFSANDEAVAKLRQTVLNNRVSSVADQLSPWSLMIRNGSNRDIVGYAIKWTITLPDGRSTDRVVSQRQSELLDSAYPGLKKQIRSQPGIAIKYGQSALVTPTLAVTGESFNIPDSVLNADVATEASSYNRAQSIVISVDVIVLSDGQIFGPDKSKLGQRVQQEATSLYSLFSQILDNQAKGVVADDMFAPAAKLAGDTAASPENIAALQSVTQEATAKGAADATEKARYILLVRQRLGNDRAIQLVREQQFTTRPVFTRPQYTSETKIVTE